MAPKTTFFSSGQSSLNFEFAQAVSYQKKLIKNNGERIFALSIAVFYNSRLKIAREVIALTKKYTKILQFSILNWQII